MSEIKLVNDKTKEAILLDENDPDLASALAEGFHKMQASAPVAAPKQATQQSDSIEVVPPKIAPKAKDLIDEQIDADLNPPGDDQFGWSRQVMNEIQDNPKESAYVALGAIPGQEISHSVIAAGRSGVDVLRDPKREYLKQYLEQRARQHKNMEINKAKIPTASTPVEFGSILAQPDPFGKLGLLGKAAGWGLANAGDALARGEGSETAAMAGGLGLGMIAAPQPIIKGAKWAGKKGLSALTGIAPDAIERYLQRPNEILNKARQMPEIARDAYEKLLGIKKSMVEGSAKSYEILDQAKGWLYPRDVQEIYALGRRVLADMRTGRSEGVGPVAKQAYGKMAGILQDFGGAAGIGTKNPGMHFPDAKKTLQDLDEIEGLFGTDRSEFGKKGIEAVRTFRNAIRSKLGEKVDGFDAAMAPVASDAALYGPAKEIVGDLNMTEHRLGQLANPKTKRAEDIEVLKQFGDRVGNDYQQEVSDRMLLNQFDKDLTRGSRNVNLYGMLGRAAVGGGVGAASTDGGFGGLAGGAMLGAGVDKYGGRIAKGILDIMKSRGMMAFGRFSSPLIQASRQGNRALAAEHLRLMNSEPEYKQLILRMGEN